MCERENQGVSKVFSLYKALEVVVISFTESHNSATVIKIKKKSAINKLMSGYMFPYSK